MSHSSQSDNGTKQTYQTNNENHDLTRDSEKSSLPSRLNSEARWINNYGREVEEVFGFNKNAELVNGRAAMIGFFMLILNELIFTGDPVTHSIFNIT